jgi:hypothetical protein
MQQIADAIAIDGFGELADVTRDARLRAGTASDALTRIAHAYLNFARDNPAVYDAMFTRATTLRFAAQDTPPQLTAAFAELRQAVGLVADEQGADALTELLWAALHGLVTLSHAGRLRPGYDSQRLQLLVNQFTSTSTCRRRRTPRQYCETSFTRLQSVVVAGFRSSHQRTRYVGTSNLFGSGVASLRRPVQRSVGSSVPARLSPGRDRHRTDGGHRIPIA